MFAIKYDLTCDRCGATATDDLSGESAWVALDRYAASAAGGWRDRWAEPVAVLCDACAKEYAAYESAIEADRASALVFAGAASEEGTIATAPEDGDGDADGAEA